MLRIIGRLSFPIFGYMISEGCRYTKNRTRYLFSILSVGLICQIAYFVAEGSYYQCILITFSMSVSVIYTIDMAIKKQIPSFCPMAAVAAVFFLCEVMPLLIPFTDYGVDYGFCGVLYPCLVYIASGRKTRLFAALIGLSLIAMSGSAIQWYSLLALIPLMLYNGKRGKFKLKGLFYIYYPLHLAVIYMISMVIPFINQFH